jgi:3-methyl-2-oxobutanoate hydroxymethyltransferase
MNMTTSNGSTEGRIRRVTTREIALMAAEQQPIAVITAYDATSARLGEEAGAPILLVGDSLGMVVQGHEYPIPVTLDQMVYHTGIVARVTRRPLIAADLPFMTYQLSPEQALANAARLVQEGGAQAVKLEGGAGLAPTIRRIVEAGIPVIGHVGLQPQSVHAVGGLRAQGREAEAAAQIVRDALAVEAAGAFAIVLEAIPAPLAALISERLVIPTIGIGAGPHTDGQVQVFHDLLQLFEGFAPRHARQYARAGDVMREALQAYVRDVAARAFPTDAHSYSMKPEVLAAVQQALGSDAAPHSLAEAGHDAGR